MAKSTTHVILGKEATVFVDTSTGFTVTDKERATKLPNDKFKTKRVINAIKGGHLQWAEEDQIDEEKDAADEKLRLEISGKQPLTKAEKAEKAPEKTTADELKKMTNAELETYYQDNYTVSDDDLKAFKKMNKDEKVTFLTEDED